MLRRVLTLAVVSAVGLAPQARADAFDLYSNPILRKAPDAEGVKEIKQLTFALMAEHDSVLPKTDATFVVVRTNDDRYAKLLVRPGFRKVSADRRIPMLSVERFVTYKEGEERQVVAEGKNLNLFAGFRFSLDIGQVVPEELGGDLRLVVDGDKTYVEPINKAKLYLMTKPMPEAAPKKTTKFEIGDRFEARYFNGVYKLFSDGRRSGTLKLKVSDDGDVTGDFYTDKDGQKYEVHGKVGTPLHAIQFAIKFPRTEESFTGFLFTGDGKALAGTSKMLEREAGFYAVRVEE